MQNALWAALAPPVAVPHSILIQNWCKMLSGLPWLLLWWFPMQRLFKGDAKCSLDCLGSSCGGFRFNSYSKLMQNSLWATLAPPVVVPHPILIQNWCRMLSGLPWFLLWWLLIKSSFKCDSKCSLGCLGPSCGGFLFSSYSVPVQNRCKILSGLPWLLLWRFRSVRIQNWCKMLSGLPWLPLWCFFIQLLFNKYSSGCLGSSCGGCLFSSYPKLMQNALWAALAPPVVVSYSILIQNWC